MPTRPRMLNLESAYAVCIDIIDYRKNLQESSE